ncbi:PaaI family thioesterase [Minwuia sp.]|uniref:PaaI family thioesterase n=1 Tax=Minwuia sp. TaxID=2493630 RepID=UPI003A93C293
MSEGDSKQDPNEVTWFDKVRMMGDHAQGQFRALNLNIVEAKKEAVIARLPWQEELVGDTEGRILHGGAITTLIDSACGYALFAYLEALGDIATLDLRIDYLKPALPDQDVFARAEVYRTTKSIAFLRASAYQTEGDPIANAVATFMLGANAAKLAAKGIRT